MKRAVWLFLAVFCIVLAQVQPTGWAKSATQVCTCCKAVDPHELPDCCPPATSGALNLGPAESVLTGASALRSADQGVRDDESKFYSCFVEAATVSVAPPASAFAAHAESVPLFKVHCSFLI